jgi:hypothetical protein
MHPTPTLAQEGIYAEGGVGLLWHNAAGQTVTLDYLYVNQPTPDVATLMHMAETVTFATKTIPLPFSVTGVKPAQAYSTSGTADLSKFPVSNTLSYRVGDTMVSITADPPPAMAPSPCSSPQTGMEADEVVNGLHMYVTEISTNGRVAVDMSKTGTPQSILKRITSYGPDPAKWTTNVLTQ